MTGLDYWGNESNRLYLFLPISIIHTKACMGAKSAKELKKGGHFIRLNTLIPDFDKAKRVKSVNLYRSDL